MSDHYQEVVDDLLGMGFLPWHVRDLIHACSPRWTVSAASMIDSENRDALFLLVKGARYILPEDRHKLLSDKDKLIVDAFRQIGWTIPATAPLKAYLHCANLAFKYAPLTRP